MKFQSDRSNSIIRNGGLQSMLTPPFSVKCHFLNSLCVKRQSFFFPLESQRKQSKRIVSCFCAAVNLILHRFHSFLSFRSTWRFIVLPSKFRFGVSEVAVCITCFHFDDQFQNTMTTRGGNNV